VSFRRTAFALAAIVPVFDAHAAEPEPSRFGSRGNVVVSSDFVLAFRNERDVLPQGRTTEVVNTLTLAPALDYFFLDAVSLGLRLAYTRVSAGDDVSTSFAFGPRVGYDLDLGERISLWPKATLEYRVFSTTAPPLPEGLESAADYRGGVLTVRADVPLLVHPVAHFFVGIGPFLGVDVLSRLNDDEGSRHIELGGTSVVGGWF
jgi:hypothetical protein